jgi:PTH1 family peptidyl-tRNA hydrolase
VTDLLDAAADAALHLAKGQDVKFLSEVARRSRDDHPEATDDVPPPKKPVAPAQPKSERTSKRQSALAENLKKWLAGRKSKDDNS